MDILSFSEIRSVEVPNSPDRRGKRGSFIIFRFRVSIPSEPVKRIRIIAFILLPFSLKIRNATEAIRR
jgi:hypothetical protein